MAGLAYSCGRIRRRIVGERRIVDDQGDGGGRGCSGLSVEEMARQMGSHGIPTTQPDLNYAGRVVYAEAGVRDVNGKQMVAWVMANRWLYDNYHERKGGGRHFSWRGRRDLGGIVRNPGQFAPVNKILSRRARQYGCQDIVYEAFTKAVDSTAGDPTHGALYFYNPWHVWPRQWYPRFPIASDGVTHLFFGLPGDDGRWRNPVLPPHTAVPRRKRR
jgi:hypothetical protein